MPTPSDVPTHGILCSPMGVFRGTDGLRCYSPGQAHEQPQGIAQPRRDSVGAVPCARPGDFVHLW